MAELTLDNFCTRHKFIANPYFKNCRGLIPRRFAILDIYDVEDLLIEGGQTGCSIDLLNGQEK